MAPDKERLSGANDQDIEKAIADYNSFEKLRDPSHGFAPPPQLWLDVLADHGFTTVAHEQMEKEIAFAPWVARMRCTPDVIAELEQILTAGSAHLRAFLKPRRDEQGGLHFTLQEVLLVANKAD